MTSYKGLLNKIEAFCSAHFQIEKYAGEFKEQMPNFATKDEKYPIVYVVPQSDTSDLNTNQFTLDVYCVDIIQKDRANINNIVSDCNLIVNDLYLYFLDGNDLSIDVVGSSSGDPVNNFDLDYTAGWVKTITFEVNQYNVCAIPMSPINPNPPLVCDPANYNLVDTLDNILSSGSINSGATSNIVVQNSTVENSDSSFVDSVTAEGTLVLNDITVSINNSLNQLVNQEVKPSAIDVTVNAPDSSYSVTDSLGTTLYNGTIASGEVGIITVGDSTVSNSDASYSASILAEGSLTLPDITVNVVNTLGTLVNPSTSPSVQDVTIEAPDATINIKKTGDGTIASIDVPSGTTANYSVADNAITVNGGSGFTIDATDPLNIVLSDGTSTVTPVSVTPNAGLNKVDIVLPTNSPTYASARLLKTGQTTSYRTGDDGDFEAGRNASFTTLLANNPFGNTNRFTSEVGTQTYTNNIVIDWSTYDGVSVLGYRRTRNGSLVTWNTAIDGALSVSIGAFTTGWRLPNIHELTNLNNSGSFPLLNYSPINLNLGGSDNLWSSSTIEANAGFAYYGNYLGYSFQPKTSTAQYIPCRTFTVTGTTLS